MTELFPDQGQAFLDGGLTPGEQVVLNDVTERGRSAADLVAVAAALAGAFFLYRSYMKRRIKEEMSRYGEWTPNTLETIAATIWTSFIPRWVTMTSAALVSGYLQGMREANSGSLPEQLMYDVAAQYAAELGMEINDVSVEAMLTGYQRQINMKVVPRVALARVAESYGVPPRAMNALVTVHTSKTEPKVTGREITDTRSATARLKVDQAIVQRGRTIGETEAYSAKNQAKQLVWMYAQSKGTLPQTATKVWVTADDERVCPSCGPMHLVEAMVDEQFTTPNGQVWAPGLHTNCRCDMQLKSNVVRDFYDYGVQNREFNDKALVSKRMHEKSAFGVIHKARGDDSYDRDRSGRFAAQESRPVRINSNRIREYKEPTQVSPEVAAILQQMKEYQALPTVEEVLEIDTPAQTGKVSSGKVSSGLVSSGKVSSHNKVSSEVKVPSRATTPSSRRVQSYNKVNTPKISETGMSRVANIAREKISQGVPPKSSDKWINLDTVVYANVSNEQGDGERFILGSRDKVYAGKKSIYNLLEEHWEEVRDDLEGYWDSNERITIGDFYDIEVPNDMYNAAVSEAINEVSKESSEVVWLNGWSKQYQEPIEFRATLYDLRKYYHLDDMVEENYPTVLAMYHGQIGGLEINWRYNQEEGEGVNPGKWVARGTGVDPETNIRFIWVEPEDFYTD